VRDLAVLLLHLLATVARLAGPGGARSVVAESVLVRHQLLILNRSRKRSPKLRLSDRMIAGLCALLIRPSRLIRSAIVLKPRSGAGSWLRPSNGSLQSHWKHSPILTLAPDGQLAAAGGKRTRVESRLESRHVVDDRTHRSPAQRHQTRLGALAAARSIR
jgi:hypothetical protein